MRHVYLGMHRGSDSPYSALELPSLPVHLVSIASTTYGQYSMACQRGHVADLHACHVYEVLSI